jgi:hypothetical protein
MGDDRRSALRRIGSAGANFGVGSDAVHKIVEGIGWW